MGDEWQDLCQEVVWALVRAVRERRAPTDHAVNAYIGSIVHNQFVTWLRKHGGRSAQLKGAGPGEEDSQGIEELAETCDETVNDDRVAARRVLARLPLEWQSLLVAHYVEGCTVDALVSANGTSRATLNRELKRARDEFCRQWLGRGEILR